MKTKAQWDESRQDLGRFLQVGDVVDEEIADYFLCVLPPVCMVGGIIQIGEPNSHVNGRATYATIKRTPEGWVYCGNCHRGQTAEPVGGDWLDRHIAEQRANYKAAGVSDEMLASAADYSEADEVRDAAKKADKPITQLACACCGGVTRGRQWFNQDSGYGICGDCIAWLRKPKSDTGPARESEEYIRDCYGIEGKHFNVA